MDRPDLRIELTNTAFPAGAELAGAFVLAGGRPPDCRGVELTVQWQTSGKGSTDLAFAYIQYWRAADGTLAGLGNPHPFVVRLPRTPLSYDGPLVKIGWLARVRVEYGADEEVEAETPFTLTPDVGP